MRVVPAAIIGFLVIMAFVHWIKPHMVYEPDGSLREFGLGSSKKTVTPMWVVAILAAIAAYSVAYLKID